MKNKIKRVLCVVLVAMLLCSLMTMTAFAIDVEPDTVAIVHYTSGGVEHNDEYSTLDSALAAAYRGDVVYLIKSAPLSDNAEVKPGVNLVVTINGSMDSVNSLKTGANNITGNGSSTDETQEPSVTLTVPAGKALTVNGTLIVAGNQQSTQPRSGFRTGDYGAIDLQGTIAVETGGELYARGEIMSTGETTGTVTAKSGSSVYERFQIADWRGGTASNNAKEADVFPFSLYDLGGISAELVLNSGAQLYGQTFIVARNVPVSTNIPVITYSDREATDEYVFEGSIISVSGTEGTVTFTTGADNVKTITTKNATVRSGSLNYSIKILGFEIFGFDSADMDCPFGYHMNVVLDEGTRMEIGTRLKIMPQCTFTVKSDAQLIITDGKTAGGKVVNGSMNFYGTNGYQKEYYFGNAAKWDYKEAAKLVVETGGKVEVGTNNIISSTDQSFTNVDGFSAVVPEELTYVGEYDQATSQALSVPFYVGTPDTTTPPTPAE